MHPDDVPFLFEQQSKRMGASLVGSFAFQMFVAALLILASRYAPQTRAAFLPIEPNSDIVWLAEPGPGGGGGGGGNKMPDPPRTAEAEGKDKITVPVKEPPKIQPVEQPKETPKPVQEMNIPAQAMAVGVQELPGVISGVPAVSASQGSGSGGGAGSGEGTGVGPGKGSGYGPGEGGGTGGGVYRPGNGVVSPRLLQEVKPNYTADAMRAKIQGVVTLEAVVNPDGSVGNVSIVRSLDPTFGLDQEAIKTVRKWRFAPGTRFGQPVPVLVEIEMTFTLR